MLLKRYAKMGPKKKLPEMKIEFKYYFSKADFFLFFFNISISFSFQFFVDFDNNFSLAFQPFDFFVLTWKSEAGLLTLLVQDLANLQVLDVVLERMVRIRNRDCVILLKDLQHCKCTTYRCQDRRNFFWINLELLNCNFISLDLSISFLNCLKLIGNK